MTALDAPRLTGTSRVQHPDAGGGPAPPGPLGEVGPVQRLADACVWVIFRLSGVRS